MPVAGLPSVEPQQAVEIALDDLHGARIAGMPAVLEGAKGAARLGLRGRVEDRVEGAAKFFARGLAHAPQRVAFGVYLTALGLGVGKGGTEGGFQAGQSVHDAELDGAHIEPTPG